MGFDMYLEAEIWGAGLDESDHAVEVKAVVGSHFPVQSIFVGVAYWKGAYHLDAWLVKHAFNGVEHEFWRYLDSDKLDELLAQCQRVMADRTLAQKLLPPAPDDSSTPHSVERYFENTQAAIDQLTYVRRRLPDSWEFRYKSGW